MKHFLKRVAVILCSCFIIIVVTNLVLNYDYLMRDKFLVANIKSNSRMIGNKGLRYYKLLMAQNKAIDSSKTIIIGSSRTLAIGSNFGISNVVNFSVPGLHLFDLKHYIQALSGNRANTVFISIDPWVFNSNSPVDTYKTEYDRGTYKSVQSLLSYTYFRKNVDLFIYYLKKPQLIDTIEADGSRKFIKDHDCEKTKTLVNSYLLEKGFENDEFRNFIVDDAYVAELGKLFSQASHFKKVIIWLQPLNPVFINASALRTVKEKIVLSENIIKELSLKNNFEVHGSFFQQRTICDFEDHKHFSRMVLKDEYNLLLNKKK